MRLVIKHRNKRRTRQPCGPHRAPVACEDIGGALMIGKIDLGGVCVLTWIEDVVGTKSDSVQAFLGWSVVEQKEK